MASNPKVKRAPSPAWTEEQHAKLRDLYFKGWKLLDIADEVGKSLQGVHRQVRKHNLKHERDLFRANEHQQALDRRDLNLVRVDLRPDEVNKIASEEAEVAVRKAFEFARKAGSIRDLNAAMSAAQKAGAIYRRANGLNVPGSVMVRGFLEVISPSENPLRTVKPVA